MTKNALSYIILLIGILFTTISCDDNSKSLGTFRITIATVVPETNRTFSLLLDNGKKLWPAASDIAYNTDNNKRVFLNYTILSDKLGEYDHYVKVNDIWDIVTKQVVELNVENESVIGNDPVKANEMWVGGDYLNVSFMFNYGGVRPHTINLVNNKLSSGINNESIELEFRHNAFGSEESRLYEGFICFDLKPLRVNNADSVKISIKVLEWADDSSKETKETIHNVIYRYNQPTTQARVEMPIPVISSSEYY